VVLLQKNSFVKRFSLPSKLELVRSPQMKKKTHQFHTTFCFFTGYAGENALELCSGDCNQDGFNQIVKEATQYGPIAQFTYLRLSPSLLSGNNWNVFQNFVKQMHNA
jgi:hypothetical protein